MREWETGQNTSVHRGRSITTIARQKYHNGRNLGSGWNVNALEIKPEIGKLIETIAAVPVVPVSEEYLILKTAYRWLLFVLSLQPVVCFYST